MAIVDTMKEGTQLVTRNRKSLEEQLAETQSKQAQVKARLAELELRRKARDRRLRNHGERILLRLMLQRIEDDPSFANAIRRSIDTADLRPNEREAVLWLMEPGEAVASGHEPAAAANDPAAG